MFKITDKKMEFIYHYLGNIEGSFYRKKIISTVYYHTECDYQLTFNMEALSKIFLKNDKNT